jgi:hypothetical protein
MTLYLGDSLVAVPIATEAGRALAVFAPPDVVKNLIPPRTIGPIGPALTNVGNDIVLDNFKRSTLGPYVPLIVPFGFACKLLNRFFIQTARNPPQQGIPFHVVDFFEGVRVPTPLLVISPAELATLLLADVWSGGVPAKDPRSV